MVTPWRHTAFTPSPGWASTTPSRSTVSSSGASFWYASVVGVARSSARDVVVARLCLFRSVTIPSVGGTRGFPRCACTWSSQTLERLHEECNPYHNSTHACSVVQVLDAILSRASPKFSALETASALLAAIVHDVGHLGVTNGFLCREKHPVHQHPDDGLVRELASKSRRPHTPRPHTRRWSRTTRSAR